MFGFGASGLGGGGIAGREPLAVVLVALGASVSAREVGASLAGLDEVLGGGCDGRSVGANGSTGRCVGARGSTAGRLPGVVGVPGISGTLAGRGIVGTGASGFAGGGMAGREAPLLADVVAGALST